MKIRYRLFKRGQYYYSEDVQSGKQQSLKTGNRTEAQRLVAAKNEAINNAQFTLAIGQTYLAVTDAQILTRTWKEVMDVVVVRGGTNTQNRCVRAFKASVFEKIRQRPILQTTASDFLAMLADGKSSTSHYLKLLHTAAFDLGWLAGRTILTRKAWTPVAPKPKRAITWDEHCTPVAPRSFALLWILMSRKSSQCLQTTAKEQSQAKQSPYMLMVENPFLVGFSAILPLGISILNLKCTLGIRFKKPHG